MSLVYADLSVSADGYSTGYNQREDAPFGDGVDDALLHGWMFEHGENHRARAGFSGRTDVVPVFDAVPPRPLQIGAVRATPEVTHITDDLR